MAAIPTKYTEKDWNEVRAAFSASIMINTSMSSLAQNLDGPDWPIKSKDESPAKYVELSFDELQEMLALKGFPGHVDLLVTILKETLAFDAPFGEMVEQTQVSAIKDNQLLKNMVKLGIPEGFPIGLTALGGDTLEFCKLEKLTTLGEFAIFAQGMSQNVIVGGDFKKLLNALSHVDEKAVVEFLPYRLGSKGLHLIECLAQSSRRTDAAARAAQAAEWFKEELTVLQRELAAGSPLSRQLMPLGNPAAEASVAELLKPYVKSSGATKIEKKSGLLGGLFGWFKK
ncbi:MAG: hypothetical protein KA257_02365 [Opitutaceae bacterium]|nr:hypothetical protein [Opitutaceae bacterium]